MASAARMKTGFEIPIAQQDLETVERILTDIMKLKEKINTATDLNFDFKNFNKDYETINQSVRFFSEKVSKDYSDKICALIPDEDTPHDLQNLSLAVGRLEDLDRENRWGCGGSITSQEIYHRSVAVDRVRRQAFRIAEGSNIWTRVLAILQ